MTIPDGETVLQIEELTTTGKTLNAVQKAVNIGNRYRVNWVKRIGIFVHRPWRLPIIQYGDRRVRSLIKRAIWTVDQIECPMCRAGSPRYKPETHWKDLTGEN